MRQQCICFVMHWQHKMCFAVSQRTTAIRLHARVFNHQRVCRAWLETRTEQGHDASWQGHTGAAYAAALMQTGGQWLLATAGDDGYVRLWHEADITAAATTNSEASAQPAADADGMDMNTDSQQQSVVAAAAVQIPHVSNPLGISEGNQPAAQVLAVNEQHQQLFVGASDGGVHVVDVPHLLAGAAGAAGPNIPQQSATAAIRSLSGHAAGVLGLDYSAATQQLASGSEDGTVRIWDCTTLQCINTISPCNEVVVPQDQPLQQLRCVMSKPVTCLKFDQGGRWLLAGNGNGSLTLWNCTLNAPAKHKGTSKSTPQALLLTPSTVYMAGTDKRLYRYTFLLEDAKTFQIGAESAYGMALDAETGMLAVCGSKGCIDLLSPIGATLGVIRPPSSVLIN
eukprot:GHRR01018868.1.p1 GENE.GHRR01018868.1~~GHRR01018868.1.p1  ORF type:complete len:396 (+),score=136.69 GHRR01018868.1:762-1949(+)